MEAPYTAHTNELQRVPHRISGRAEVSSVKTAPQPCVSAEGGVARSADVRRHRKKRTMNTAGGFLDGGESDGRAPCKK